MERGDGTDWQHDIGRYVIPATLAGGEHLGRPEVSGHGDDTGTVERHQRAHLTRAAAGPQPALPVERMPRTIRPEVDRGCVADASGAVASLVPPDLGNEGRAERSVLLAGVRVGAGARVRRDVVVSGARAVIRPGQDSDSAVVLENGLVQRVEDTAAVMEGT